MTPPFRNPVGDPNGTPPATPFELDSMPALSLCAIPEPGSLTLVGLAAAVVLVVHRLAMRLYKR